MASDSEQNKLKPVTLITLLGMLINLILAGLKLVVGYSINSMGLISDGFHSFSDLASDVIVLFGAWFALRPPDDNHPYGHGKFETLASWMVAVLLIITGGWIAWESIEAFMEPSEVSHPSWVIIVAAISIGFKEFLYHLTVRIGRKLHSSVVIANAWHHRSDGLSSIVVLMGGFFSIFNWNQADSIAGIIVGVMIALVGTKLSYEAIMELSETSPGKDIEKDIHRIITEFKDVKGYHRLRVRRIGRELEMDIHILLDEDISLKDGHSIATRIEEAINAESNWSINNTIHIEPDDAENRKTKY